MTSHDVVARVRRATGEQSVGHRRGSIRWRRVCCRCCWASTRGWRNSLAQAKGVCGNDALRVRNGYVRRRRAEGRGCVRGSVDAGRGARCGGEVCGEIEQMPPPYSAKKVDGKPAYKLAREGEESQLKPVKIHVGGFAIESVDGDTAQFTMRISAGGYVRAIAHAMGQALGAGRTWRVCAGRRRDRSHWTRR